MRIRRPLLVPIIFASFYAHAFAAPVVFDTDDAHVIVARSVDAWSGDASVSEDSLDAIRDKKAIYGVATTSATTGEKISIFGGAGAFGFVTNHPVTRGVQAELLKKNVKLAQNGKAGFEVFEPTSIAPAEMAAITQAQTEYFKQLVISQGDLETLPGRIRTRKFFGGVLALGTTFLAMDKLGAVVGSSATLGSGITNDIYRVIAKNRGAIAPINLPNVDFTQYKNVDVRVIKGAADRMGQIVIAYKQDKTPQAEQEALIQAIVVATGADTNVEEVQKSRALDLANRHSIWEACLAEGKCKKD